MDNAMKPLAVCLTLCVCASLHALDVNEPEFKLWQEVDARGKSVPYYSIKLKDGMYSEPRATSYELKLRYEQFTPLVDGTKRMIDDKLTSGRDTNLYIVQFHTQPLESYRKQLRAHGVEVYSYLPRHSHIVRMDSAIRNRVEALPCVRWVGQFHPAYRLDESILDDIARGDDDSEMQTYSIQVFQRGMEHQQNVADRIKTLGGSIMNTSPDGFRMTVVMNLNQLMNVVRMDEVHFIDPWGPGEVDMDIVREISGANDIEALGGFSGEGVRGEIFDSELLLTHPEWLNPPIVHFNGSTIPHGTSSYGVLFAQGLDPNARGLLPDGQGIFCFYEASTVYGGPFTPLLLNTEATDPDGPYRSVLHTSSVGSPRTTEYTTISAETDDVLFQVDYFSCQSMSNAFLQPQTRPQAWAKNIVAVGGVVHENTVDRADDYADGSTGPAADGRVKPDLTHFYDWIYTTSASGGYIEYGGTSGATPCTAGHAGLVFQMWHEEVFPGFGGGATVFDSRPNSTTVKAMLVNTAYRYDWNSGGPNSNLWRTRQGWGMVNVGELYDYRNKIFIIDESDVLENLESTEYTLTVPPGEPVFRATMVYIDPAGNPSATEHRINDLSLKVTSPTDTVYWGNNGLHDDNWSTSGGVANTIDTVENVFIQNPDPGEWIVEVIASEIIEDSYLDTPELDVDYALIVTGVDMNVCPADLTGDDQVNINDIFEALGLWGDCPDPCPPYCAGDLTEDCTVNIDDIFAILGMWGPCD